MANISFLLVLLVLSFSSLTVANDLIADVCSSYVADPSFCLEVLRSDPRTRGTDLLGLGRIVIDIAQSNGTSVLQLVESLAKKTTDPKLKEDYDSCSKKYDGAVIQINGALTDLNSVNYNGVGNHASNAMFLADSCDNNFVDHSAEPQQLRQASTKFQGLCSIISAISASL